MREAPPARHPAQPPPIGGQNRLTLQRRRKLRGEKAEAGKREPGQHDDCEQETATEEPKHVVPDSKLDGGRIGLQGAVSRA